ncbi:MAG: phosphate regulon sensor histidine kinase PhoR [Halorhodospira sp.]
MNRNPWLAYLVRAGAVALLVAMVGALSGRWVEAAAVALLGGYLWSLWHLQRLERWLRLGRDLDPPLSVGVWGDVFYMLQRRQRQQRERRHRLWRVIREYRESAKAMPDATVVLYANHRVLWWNNAARRLLGLSWPEDEGQRICNLIRSPAFRTFLEQGAQTADPITFPSPIDPRTKLEMRLVPYGREQRLLIARDVTRTEKLETMRRDFVANVSHELKTPLTVIYGVAEEMEEELAEHRPDWAGAIGSLRSQAHRMYRLVQDLLMLSRLETGEVTAEREPIQMSALLDELCAEARALSGERGHRIELEVQTGVRVIGAESELRSAISNLLSNAVRYTPEGGGIRVTWEVREGGAYCRVADDGLGIPREHLPRLTERFYRVDKARSNATGGTGLGLAIVKHVISRHGGRLEIDSEPGQGSTFTLVFPPRAVTREVSSSLM